MKRAPRLRQQSRSKALPKALAGVLAATALAFACGALLWIGSLSSSLRDVVSTIGHAEEVSAAGFKVGIAYVPPPDTPGARIYAEEGFEAALAQALGKELGTAVEIVHVPLSDQAQALSERGVDAVIARVAFDDPLHQSALVVPTGYQSGLSPVVRSDQAPERWSDLAGKVVCVTESNVHAQHIARALGAEVRILKAPAQALMLVRTGECGAAIHDRALLDLLFQRMSWQKFSATLPPVEPTALVVAVARGRDDLARTISRALAEVGSAAQWQNRREKWASLVSFEVYRDQVVGDCH